MHEDRGAGGLATSPSRRVWVIHALFVVALVFALLSGWALHQIPRFLLGPEREHPALVSGIWTPMFSEEPSTTLDLWADGLATDSRSILQPPTRWYVTDVEHTTGALGVAQSMTATLYFYDHDSSLTWSVPIEIKTNERPFWDEPLVRTMEFDAAKAEGFESNNIDTLGSKWICRD